MKKYIVSFIVLLGRYASFFIVLYFIFQKIEGDGNPINSYFKVMAYVLLILIVLLLDYLESHLRSEIDKLRNTNMDLQKTIRETEHYLDSFPLQQAPGFTIYALVLIERRPFCSSEWLVIGKENDEWFQVFLTRKENASRYKMLQILRYVKDRSTLEQMDLKKYEPSPEFWNLFAEIKEEEEK